MGDEGKRLVGAAGREVEDRGGARGALGTARCRYPMAVYKLSRMAVHSTSVSLSPRVQSGGGGRYLIMREGLTQQDKYLLSPPGVQVPRMQLDGHSVEYTGPPGEAESGGPSADWASRTVCAQQQGR